MSTFFSTPSLKKSWLLKIAVFFVGLILLVAFINFIKSDYDRNLSVILYLLGFLIGIFLLEKIIRTLFPNRGKILRYLAGFPIFRYNSAPHWVVLFSICFAIAYWYDLPAWIFIILAVLGVVTLLRINDTSNTN